MRKTRRHLKVSKVQNHEGLGSQIFLGFKHFKAQWRANSSPTLCPFCKEVSNVLQTSGVSSARKRVLKRNHLHITLNSLRELLYEYK